MPVPIYQDTKLIDSVRDNINKIPRKKIAQLLGISVQTIRKIVKKYGIYVDPKSSGIIRSEARKKNKTSLSQEHDLYIQENYLSIPVKRIATNIGRSQVIVRTRLRQLGLVIPPEIIQKRKEDSRLKPGNKPFNKGKKAKDYLSPEAFEKLESTSFRKGNVPKNTLYDGAESVRTDKSGVQYVWLRISKGKWRCKHVVEYEKANGPIPKGFVLRCKTKNTINTNPDNWELITKRKNMLKNSGSSALSDGYVLGLLGAKNPELKQAIKDEYPELIEIKKQQLFLNRKIKSHEQKQNNRKN